MTDKKNGKRYRIVEVVEVVDGMTSFTTIPVLRLEVGTTLRRECPAAEYKIQSVGEYSYIIVVSDLTVNNKPLQADDTLFTADNKATPRNHVLATDDGKVRTVIIDARPNPLPADVPHPVIYMRSTQEQAGEYRKVLKGLSFTMVFDDPATDRHLPDNVLPMVDLWIRGDAICEVPVEIRDRILSGKSPMVGALEVWRYMDNIHEATEGNLRKLVEQYHVDNPPVT